MGHRFEAHQRHDADQALFSGGSGAGGVLRTIAFDAPALFPVSWAGEDGTAGWMDIGREFTEQWHHQMQVREAVGAAPLSDPAWHRAVLLISIRGLPHSYRGVAAPSGASFVVDITGDAGGTFTLRRDGARWQIFRETTRPRRRGRYCPMTPRGGCCSTGSRAMRSAPESRCMATSIW